MQEMAAKTRASSRLYSKTTDNGEIVQCLVSNLAAELAHLPHTIDLRSVEQVERVAVAYVDACAKAGTIPSKVGYCRAAGISRQAVDYFLSHHAEEASAEKLRIIFDGFAEMMNSAALASACHPIVALFLSKCLYGYKETFSIEAEAKQNPLGDRPKIKDILARYSPEELDMIMPE